MSGGQLSGMPPRSPRTGSCARATAASSSMSTTRLPQGAAWCSPRRIHELVEIVQQTTLNGRHLLASSSIMPGKATAQGRWRSTWTSSSPHGNNAWAPELRKALSRSRHRLLSGLADPDQRGLDVPQPSRDRRVCLVGTLYPEATAAAGGTTDSTKWPQLPRETTTKHLTGFQTVPRQLVALNTGLKRSFFYRLAEITGSRTARPWANAARCSMPPEQSEVSDGKCEASVVSVSAPIRQMPRDAGIADAISPSGPRPTIRRTCANTRRRRDLR